MIECSVTGCPEPVRARGLCVMHYKRWMKYGSTGPVGRVRGRSPKRVEVEGGKVCNRCGIPQSMDSFYDDPRCLTDGKRGSCKTCHSTASYASRKKTGRGIGHEANRDRNLRSHDMTMAEYDQMTDLQGGRCASCGGPPTPAGRGTLRLVVDHNHQTGHIRGLLCNRCNLGLGFFLDDPEKLRLAALYLERTDHKTEV